jgi:DNA-directed RNA polymerase alpha subunit
MRQLNLFEPGELLGTVSKEGHVTVFRVGPDGALMPLDRMFASGVAPDDPIDVLNFSVRAYNVLKREGVNTIDEMLEIYKTKGAQGFDEMRNMGERSRDEVVSKIRELTWGEPAQ